MRAAALRALPRRAAAAATAAAALPPPLAPAAASLAARCVVSAPLAAAHAFCRRHASASAPAPVPPPPLECVPIAAASGAAFASLLPGHAAHLAARLARAGIAAPTAAQAAALPRLCAPHGPDILLQSVTGSGKTLAYALPLLARLDHAAAAADAAARASAAAAKTPDAALPPAAPQALVLAPTRELAVQVASVLSGLAAASRGSAKRKAVPIRVERLVGLPTEGLTARLRREPPHIAVVTPALAAALVAGGHLALRRLTFLVLDEADALLAPEVAPATRAVLAAAGVRSDAGEDDAAERPPMRRVWVSATVTHAVAAAAAEAAAAARAPHPPLLLSDAAASNVVASEQPPPRLPASLSHYRLDVPMPRGGDATSLAEARAAAAARLYAALAPRGPMLVFVPAAADAAPLAAALRRRSHRAAALTAAEPRERHARAALLRALRSGRIRCLVTTEVGARGMDLRHVSVVLNASPPPSAGAYLHRAGRAARMAPGQAAPPAGVVVTLCLQPGDAADVAAAAAALGIKVPLARLHQGALLAPDGSRVALPAGGGGGGELGEAPSFGGGESADADGGDDVDGEEEAPPEQAPKKNKAAQAAQQPQPQQPSPPPRAMRARHTEQRVRV